MLVDEAGSWKLCVKQKRMDLCRRTMQEAGGCEPFMCVKRRQCKWSKLVSGMLQAGGFCGVLCWVVGGWWLIVCYRSFYLDVRLGRILARLHGSLNCRPANSLPENYLTPFLASPSLTIATYVG